MKATDIRKGHVLMIDGQPCRVMDFTHRTPGNLRAFVQVRFRNLVSGNTFDQRLAATDFLNEARLDTKEIGSLSGPGWRARHGSTDVRAVHTRRAGRGRGHALVAAGDGRAGGVVGRTPH